MDLSAHHRPIESKHKTTVLLTGEGMRLRDALRRKLGVNASGVVELALRRLAETEGVE